MNEQNKIEGTQNNFSEVSKWWFHGIPLMHHPRSAVSEPSSDWHCSHVYGLCHCCCYKGARCDTSYLWSLKSPQDTSWQHLASCPEDSSFLLRNLLGAMKTHPATVEELPCGTILDKSEMGLGKYTLFLRKDCVEKWSFQLPVWRSLVGPSNQLFMKLWPSLPHTHFLSLLPVWY